MTKILELPVGELKHALTGLAKVINGRSSLPILGHMRVEPDGRDAVCLHATDLDTFVTCRIPARNLEQFPACAVSFDQLNKLVKTSKADLALLREDDGKLLVRYAIGGSLARTPVESRDLTEWPPLPQMKSPASLLDDGFKTAFKQALECSSTDSSRYVLNGACLDVAQKDCHCIVATDGRHLFSANTFTFPLAKSVIVPDRRFLNWAGFVEDGAWHLAVEPQSNPAWVKLHSDRWTVITKAIDGTYPNWRQIIPSQDGRTRIAFTPAGVATILDSLPCLPTWHEQNLPVRLETVNNQFCLKGRASETEEWITVPVPETRIIGRGLSLTLNRTLLSKALRFGFTEFDYYSETEPIRFTAPGRKLIVMPLGTGNPTTRPAPAGAAAASEPSAAPPVTTPTEERKTMSAKRNNDSPLKEAVDQIEKIKETLKTVINDFATVLAVIKQAEKEKKATEKEVEAIRATLRSLQRVQI
jgi:DNA polymerase III sliding clamp (beta) subunit (PCNA family)/exonuclease VII small subunit